MEVRQRSLMAGILMAALVVAPMAEAKRAGGGKSHGMSRSALQANLTNNPVNLLLPHNQQQHLLNKNRVLA